jgi:carboxylesterase type B
MAQVLSDGQFVCEGRRFARSLSDARTPLFFYSYEYEIDDLFPNRVIHGVESNIIFGNNYTPPTSHPLNAADLALHAAMAGYWTRFALNGHPDDAWTRPRGAVGSTGDTPHRSTALPQR